MVIHHIRGQGTSSYPSECVNVSDKFSERCLWPRATEPLKVDALFSWLTALYPALPRSLYNILSNTSNSRECMGVDGEALQLCAVYIQTVQVTQESVSGTASHVHCVWTCYYIEGSYDKIIITVVLSLQYDTTPWKLDAQRRGLYTSPWIHGENVQDHNMQGLEECPSNKTNKTPQLGRHLSCRKWTLQYWYQSMV